MGNVKRTFGFYWVKKINWQIAKWNGRHFYMTADKTAYAENELDEINENKIVMPITGKRIITYNIRFNQDSK